MQNTGAVSIIAEIKDNSPHNPTGMVVFYYKHKYSKEGILQTDPVPDASDVPRVFYAYPGAGAPGGPLKEEEEHKNYKICGVTLVTTGSENSDHMIRSTVFVSGAVLFCNTGDEPISAGDEVWVQMKEAGTGNDSIPITYRRGLRDSNTRRNAQYLGRCLVGAAPSYLAGKRLCFGQVLLGVLSV